MTDADQKRLLVEYLLPEIEKRFLEMLVQHPALGQLPYREVENAAKAGARRALLAIRAGEAAKIMTPIRWKG